MWEVEVTCRETVKPFTPTPPHLRTHNLSWLDRIPCDNDHVPFLLFYSSPDPDYLPTLKLSLSRALAAFYPLAGRLTGDLTSVDCNDRGVGLFEARAVADAPLPRLIPSYSSSCLPPNVDLRYLHMLLPCSRSSCSSNSNGPLLNIQITTFAPCGGIAVGCCFSHKVADGHSAAMFVDAWVAFARGRGYHVPVDFGAASYFAQPSPNDKSWYNTDWATAVGLTPPPGTRPVEEERVVARMFVIKESAIRRLRESSSLPRLTRVQAVIALIWRCCKRANRRNTKPHSTVVYILVNMRGRGAALNESLFGNLWCLASPSDMGRAESRSEEKVLDAAIREIDEKRVDAYRSRGGWSSILEGASDALNQVKKETGSADVAQYKYEFSSWVRFSPLYGADFGWGKPIWVTVGDLNGKNLVVLMARGEAPGGGIEAWVSLEEKEMMAFERDEELVNCL